VWRSLFARVGLRQAAALLRHNPEKRDQFASAFEHCDMVAATLCGVTDPKLAKRSVCAMGHKWMWNPSGTACRRNHSYPNLTRSLTAFAISLGRVSYIGSPCRASRPAVGQGAWSAGRHPVPVGAFDAHWTQLARLSRGRRRHVVAPPPASCHEQEDATDSRRLWRGAGQRPSAIHRHRGGLSATGDIFEAIARRAGVKVAELSKGLEAYRAGQSGLLRLTWDNGDRTVLVNSELGGVTLGWNLVHTRKTSSSRPLRAQHFTLASFSNACEYGVPVDRVINAGGIRKTMPC